MISIGLIGCGAVAHLNYAKTLLGRAEYKVSRVYDINSRQAESAAILYSAEVSDLKSIYENSDAIIITTPPDSHAALVEPALTPGRIVICEKPYMTSFQNAKRITELANTINAKLYCGYFRRTFPQLRLARDLIASGAIGEVLSFRASEGGKFTWKATSSYTTQNLSGGVLWDTGSHTLDMALFAIGLDRYTEISVADLAVTRDKEEPSHDYKATFTIKSPNASVAGDIWLSRKDTLPNFIKISGSGGSILFTVGPDTNLTLLKNGRSILLRSTQPQQKGVLNYFDLQLRTILLGQKGADDFLAGRFVNLTTLLETMAHG